MKEDNCLFVATLKPVNLRQTQGILGDPPRYVVEVNGHRFSIDKASRLESAPEIVIEVIGIDSYIIKEFDDRFKERKVKREHKGDSVKIGETLTLYNLGKKVFSTTIQKLEINRDFFY